MSPPILLLLAAFVVVAILGPAWGIRQLNGESNAQVRLASAREGVDSVVREQLSEETGLRGYISTHDRYFLEPDGPPDPLFDGEIAALAALVEQAGVPGAVDDVHAIGNTHDRWEQQVALPLLRDPARRDSLALQTFGKVLTDELRGSAERLRTSLNNASAAAEQRMRWEINATAGASAGTVALFALAAVVLGLARAGALQRLEREHSLVDALQQTLRVGGARLPRTDIGFAYLSATAEALVGGDLLDTWRDGAETGWFMIADASGKGIQAARHSAFVQYAIRALAAENDDPAVVVSRFNRLFIDTFADPSIFVVLFLGRFDGSTHELRYCAAGHATAFVRRGRTVEQLQPTGPIVGLEPGSIFTVGSVRLGVGATVLLATDGLTEARDADGLFLGDDGVERLLAGGPAGPQDLCDLLVEEARRRSNAEIADDLAILAMTVVPVEVQSDAAFSTMEAAPRR